MTKQELIEYLEKKILLLTGFNCALPSKFKPISIHIENEIQDFRFIIEAIKNLNGETVKREQKCEHKNIDSSDGCDECLDCGVRNY